MELEQNEVVVDMDGLILGASSFLCVAGGSYAIWMLCDCIRSARGRGDRDKWSGEGRLDWLCQVVAAGIFLLVAAGILWNTQQRCLSRTRNDCTANQLATRPACTIPGLQGSEKILFSVDWTRPEKRIVGADFNGLPATDEDVRVFLQRCPHVQWLNLRNAEITDDVIEDLIGMPELTVLCLSNTSISDAGLADLASAPQIEDLVLSGTAITNGGVAYLARLPRLRILELEGTQVSQEGLDELQRGGAAASLAVIWSPVSAGGRTIASGCLADFVNGSPLP